MRSVLRCLLAAGLLLAALARGAAAQSPTSEIVAPPLVFHAAPAYELLARQLAARAPDDVQRICDVLGLPMPHRIDVHVLPRHGDVDPASLGLGEGPDWAGGWAFTAQPVIVIRSSEEEGAVSSGAAKILRHELVHAIVAQAVGPRRHDEMPRWFQEGVATHLASEWQLEESVHVAGLAMSGRYVPLEEMTHALPDDAWDARMAYLESFAFLDWLAERSGEDALRRFFAEFRTGASFRTSFRHAFGGSPEMLEDEWRGGFLWRFRWLPVLTSSATVWTGMTVLFVATGVVKRRRIARRLAALQEEQDREDALAAARDAAPAERPE
jgi:hypothetical protein